MSDDLPESQPAESERKEQSAASSGMPRRRWLRRAGVATGLSLLAGAGYWGWKQWQGSDRAVLRQSDSPSDVARELADHFPAPRDARFEYGRAETERAEAARYTNFYEFSRFKWCWRHVDAFQPLPWTLVVDGLCRQPLQLDLDDFHRRYADHLVERQYRHRCVERWAMAVPWTGIPLARLLRDADPLPQATHVRFVSFVRPEQAPQQLNDSFPWPYTEGLTIREAMVDLTMLATGMYGQPLLKQHGAPIRLVVPWKYGYKSIKSIERIELVDRQPATFWSTLNPAAYPFESNVDPEVTQPWPQTHETMLGTGQVVATQKFNGYGQQVASLY